MSSQDTPWGAEELLLSTEINFDGAFGDLSVRKVELDADEMTPHHRHQEKNEIIVLESGLIELRMNDDYVEVIEGEAHFIEAGTPHQIQNISSEVATITEIGFPFDPDDEDVLEYPYL